MPKKHFMVYSKVQKHKTFNLMIFSRSDNHIDHSYMYTIFITVIYDWIIKTWLMHLKFMKRNAEGLPRFTLYTTFKLWGKIIESFHKQYVYNTLVLNYLQVRNNSCHFHYYCIDITDFTNYNPPTNNSFRGYIGITLSVCQSVNETL